MYIVLVYLRSVHYGLHTETAGYSSSQVLQNEQKQFHMICVVWRYGLLPSVASFVASITSACTSSTGAPDTVSEPAIRPAR
jgi:hypothetical protein